MCGWVVLSPTTPRVCGWVVVLHRRYTQVHDQAMTLPTLFVPHHRSLGGFAFTKQKRRLAWASGQLSYDYP